MKTQFALKIVEDDGEEYLDMEFPNRRSARQESRYINSGNCGMAVKSTVVRLIPVPDNGFYKVVDTRKYAITEIT